MVTSPVKLVEQDINSDDYNVYSINDLPKIVLGFNIKNKYDAKRLKIKPMLRPKNIRHFYGQDQELKPIYFHGIELEPKNKVSHLCSVINRAMPVTTDSYKNILEYNRMSCNNCYTHLRDGVYPIDVDCLPKLSRNKYKSNYLFLRSLLEHDEDLPWFANWSNFNIFMLCPSILYSK